MSVAGQYTNEMGCVSSYADAKHDFHGEVFSGPGSLEKIQEYVKSNIPTSTCNNKMDENKFLQEYILDKAKNSPELTEMKSLFKQDHMPLIPELFNESVKARYVIHTIDRPQHSPQTESKIQKALNISNVNDDIYIICDVGYANVREDITLINSETNNTNLQKFYWVQNAQTLYDPAGKTAWHTGRDYGFQDGNSKFIFCWENANEKAITFFPRWNDTDRYISYNDPQYPEKMLYTNKELYLSIKANPIPGVAKDRQYSNYYEHEAYLIITDPANPGKFAYADKVLSSRGTGILSKAEIVGYNKKGGELNRFVKLLNTSIDNKIPEVYLDELLNYNSNYQILAKKVGDASQSLSCCKKKFKLQQFKDRTKGINTKHEITDIDNIVNFESNGCHMFVSYDRIAIGCALNYNCPIVLQNSDDGFILYIRQDLINIDKQLEVVLQDKNITPINIEPFIQTLKPFMDNLKKNKDFLNGLIANNVMDINDEEVLQTADNNFQLLLAKYFINIPVFELVNIIP